MPRRSEGRQGPVGRGRRRLDVEALESRRLLSVPTIDQIPTSATPGAITTTFNGDVWFTESTQATGPLGIVVYDPATQTSTPVNFLAEALTTGADGNVYAAEDPTTASGTVEIAVIDPTTMTVTDTIAAPLGTTDVQAIVPVSGSSIAFSAVNALGALVIDVLDTTADTVTAYPVGLPQQSAGLTATIGGIATSTATGGDIWFAYSIPVAQPSGPNTYQGDIGELDPTTGVVIPFAVVSGALSIAADFNGNLDFTTAYSAGNNASQIGTINATSDAITYVTPASQGLPGIALGPDGNLWFTAVGPPSVGTFDPTNGGFVQYQFGGGGDLGPIVSNPNGTLWFTDTNPEAIGEVQLAPSASPGSASISGTVFLDTAINSTYGPGDSPLAGQTVYVDLKGDGTLDPGDPSAVTDASGQYTLTVSSPGTYTVRVDTFPGDYATGPNGGGHTVTIAVGGPSPIVNLGVVQGSSIAPLHPTQYPFGGGNTSLIMAELNGLYHTVLGRDPDVPGFNFWARQLASGTSLTQVSYDFLHSAEYEGDVVGSYFTNFLDVAPTTAATSFWVSYIQATGASLERVATLFLTSPYYNALHASDADFIRSIFANVLGTNATPYQVSAWESYFAAGQTRAKMVNVAIQVADTRAVEGDYEAILVRPPDAPGLAAALQALQSGFTLVDLDVSLFSSAEFVTKAAKTVVS